MKYIILLLLTAYVVAACSPAAKFRKDEAAFNASKVTLSFTSIADMNDSHFDIKENNYFEFYRQLFDSVKNTRYPGRYTRVGDTLQLKFYDPKGKRLLGSKAVVHEGKKEIIFFK
ncbi:MAG: hypothetical protein EOO03_02580 [Chitinophagaceae bacterium]|nr:MAG: hypothetical protein EOO03_02580 [Chitinophagaceae bacterium]